MTSETPWHARYPAPASTPQFLPRADVLNLLRTRTAGRDFLLVDLRRNDHEGGTIQSSLNLPAQSLHPSLSTLYQLVKAAGVAQVIFYCGSSQGRGARAASWFRDYLDTKAEEGAAGVRSVALEGGIKGWVKAGAEYMEWVVEYDEKAWK